MRRGWLVLVLLGACGTAWGAVNLKNGNFSVSYTDLDQDGLEILRTYNSKSTVVGLFGYGWGSFLESFLVEQGDGSVSVHEYGAGAVQNYFPPGPGRGTGDALDRILEVERRLGAFSSVSQEELVRRYLSEDGEVRNTWEQNLSAPGLLPRETVRENEFFVYPGTGAWILKTPTAYLVRDSDRQTRIFDRAGRLVRWRADGREYRISYDPGGRIAFVGLPGGGGCRFRYAGDRLASIESLADGKTASYRFRGQDLVSTTNAGGFTFEYEYDAVHNLTAVLYRDGSSLRMEYQPKTYYCTKVTARDGTATEYQYFGSSDLDYGSTQIVKVPGREPKVESSRYVIVKDSLGYTRTALLDSVKDGRRLGLVYDQGKLLDGLLLGSGTRLKIEWSPEVRTTSVTGPDIEIRYRYGSPDLQRIDYRFQGDRGWLEFGFNARHQVERIVNSSGSRFEVRYRADGSPSEAQALVGDAYTFRFSGDGTLTGIDGPGGPYGPKDRAFWDRVQPVLDREFFEFYGLSVPHTLVFREGSFDCVEDILKYAFAGGRLAGLSQVAPDFSLTPR